MLDLNDVVMIMALARDGSLMKASEALGLPRSTLKRRLEQLEHKMGVRLIERSHRYLRLTAAGRVLIEQGAPLVDAARHVEQAVQSSSVGRMRVATTMDIGMELIEPLFRLVSDELDDLGFELVYTDRKIHPVRDDFDLVITLEPPTDGGLYYRPMQRFSWRCVATQRYLSEHGVPERAADLREHVCIASKIRGGISPFVWPLRAGGGQRLSPRFISTSIFASQQFVLADRGIALLPDLPSRHRVELVPVLQPEVGAESAILIVMGQRLSDSERGLKVRTMLENALQLMARFSGEQPNLGDFPSEPGAR
ncbi:MAG: LysR family transcriptional regulator [Myxococcota bacterium]